MPYNVPNHNGHDHGQPKEHEGTCGPVPLHIHACDCDISFTGFPEDQEMEVTILDPITEQCIEQTVTSDEEGNATVLLPKTHLQIDLYRTYTTSFSWDDEESGRQTVVRYFYITPKSEALIPNCPEEEEQEP